MSYALIYTDLTDWMNHKKCAKIAMFLFKQVNLRSAYMLRHLTFTPTLCSFGVMVFMMITSDLVI